jgi:hypothetical protein
MTIRMRINTPDTQEFFTSILPLYEIIIMLKQLESIKIHNSKLYLVRCPQFLCENKIDCKITVGKCSRKMILYWGTYQLSLIVVLTTITCRSAQLNTWPHMRCLHDLQLPLPNEVSLDVYRMFSCCEIWELWFNFHSRYLIFMVINNAFFNFKIASHADKAAGSCAVNCFFFYRMTLMTKLNDLSHILCLTVVSITGFDDR